MAALSRVPTPPRRASRPRGLYEWEEFRQALIAQIAAVEASGEPFAYYEIWLKTFEELLTRKQLVSNARPSARPGCAGACLYAIPLRIA